MGLTGYEQTQLRNSIVRTMGVVGLGIVAVLAVACAGTPKPVRIEDADRAAFKLRHQILFRHGEDSHVFEGYMILKRDAFFIKAFAGPGVDLFTLAREGAWHREELHIVSLADRIDLTLVSDSIAKVYLGGCAGASSGGSVTCDFYGEEMTEQYNARGQLVRRAFSSEQSRQLAIDYQDYQACSGHALPRRITLAWQGGETTMVIRLVACERQDKVDAGLWNRSDR